MEIRTERRPAPAHPYAAHDSCWYCGSKLHESRRFCNSNCAQAFEEDELAPQRHIDASADEYAIANN